MGRKHKHPEHENLERWLVSYADFITLLFATFTALYAIATAKLQDPQEVQEQIKKSFQQESLLQGIASVFEGSSSKVDSANPLFDETGKGEGVIGQYESLTYSPGEVKKVEELLEELDEVADELSAELKASLAAGVEGDDPAKGLKPEKDELEGVPLRGLEVAMQERGLRISFDSRLLFKSGNATLDERSLKFLDSVASRLLQMLPTHLVHIEGHTDATAISGRYPSNWELSTARASTVVRYLINKHKFSPTDLAAVGYADSRPLTSNSSAEGQARNRRIDIILHSREAGQDANPNEQRQGEKKLIDSTHRYTIENKSALANPKPKPKPPKPTKKTTTVLPDPQATPAPKNEGDEIHIPIFNADGTVNQASPKPSIKEVTVVKPMPSIAGQSHEGLGGK
jgi:chemotaxis protein MotB